MLEEKNLLVLSHTYNSFIKDPVEILAKHFNKVYVLVRYQPISELGNYIPLPMFSSRKKYSKRYSIDLKNKPENVEVILVPLWYLPFNFFYKFVGKQHAKGVLETLKKRKINFDIIHAHFAWSAGYAGMKVKQEYKKPLVVTGHGYDIYEMPFRDETWKRRIEEVLNSADELLTVSEYTKKFFEKLSLEKDPRVFFNGFYEKKFFQMNMEKAREKLDLPKDKKIILTIGNLEKVKGYDVLVEALKLVSEKRKDFLCVHIGEGVMGGKIKQLVKEKGLEENIVFLGRRPHEELVYWYGACDFFVSSSLSETGPVVMFESLACGKPFIGTKVGATLDVIVSEDYGKLAEPGNPEELSRNILWALDRSWDSEKIVKHSKEYTWDNTVKKIIEIYEKLL
jgi:teichuronic acid biosynthesis glycosyltransferase TuaC